MKLPDLGSGSDALLGTVTSTAVLKGAADLNGDGQADLVWQDSSINAVTIWWSGQQSNSSTLSLTTPLASIVGLGKLLDTTNTTLTYATGSVVKIPNSDIIGLDASGNILSVTGTGTEVTQAGLGSGWTFLKAVDVNGDGRADLLWENASGAVDLFTATGTGYVNQGTIGTIASGYTLLAADAASPGQTAELLWDNTTGGNLSAITWSFSGANGTTVTSSTTTQPISVLDVHAGDLNGDGHSDLIFHFSTGGTNTGVAVWDMNDGTRIDNDYIYLSNGTVAINGGTGSGSYSLSNSYKILGTADLNGDSRSDIVLQNGSILNWWYMGSGTYGNWITSQGTVTLPGTGSWNYLPLGTGNLNGGLQQDLIFEGNGGTYNGQDL